MHAGTFYKCVECVYLGQVGIFNIKFMNFLGNALNRIMYRMPHKHNYIANRGLHVAIIILLMNFSKVILYNNTNNYVTSTAPFSGHIAIQYMSFNV